MTDQTTTIADLALSQSAFLVSQAVVELDAMFGEGYAAAHPAVLAQFLQTAGVIFATQLQASAAFDLASQLDRLIGLGLACCKPIRVPRTKTPGPAAISPLPWAAAAALPVTSGQASGG